jgi:membrane protein implicated in regulation of membrane protease activity
MALSYKARKRLSLLIVMVGVPLYIMLAVTLVALLPPLPVAVEFVMYAALGVAWVFPLKSVFRGVSQPDPDAPPEGE